YNKRTEYEVFNNSESGFCHQLTAINDGINKNTFGQVFLNLRHPAFDFVDYLLGIGIFEHHHLTEYGFAFSVGSYCTITVGMTILHISNILNEYGGSLHIFNNDIFYIFYTFHLTIAQYKITLIGLFYIRLAGY